MPLAHGIASPYAIGTIEVDADTFRNCAGGFDDINSALTFASSGGIRVLGLTSGGQVTKVRLEHIWVEAGLDYEPSSGARPIEPDNWVPMDPSFKQYEFLEGLDPIAISGLDPEQLTQTFVDWKPKLLSPVLATLTTRICNWLPPVISPLTG